MFPLVGPPHWEQCLVCLRGRRLGDPSGLEVWGPLHLCGVYPGLSGSGWSLWRCSLWPRAVTPLSADGPPCVFPHLDPCVFPHLDPQCPAMLLGCLLCTVSVCVLVRVWVCVRLGPCVFWHWRGFRCSGSVRRRGGSGVRQSGCALGADSRLWFGGVCVRVGWAVWGLRRILYVPSAFWGVGGDWAAGMVVDRVVTFWCFVVGPLRSVSAWGPGPVGVGGRWVSSLVVLGGGLAEHRRGRGPASGGVCGFWTSGCHWLRGICRRVLEGGDLICDCVGCPVASGPLGGGGCVWGVL